MVLMPRNSLCHRNTGTRNLPIILLTIFSKDLAILRLNISAGESAASSLNGLDGKVTWELGESISGREEERGRAMLFSPPVIREPGFRPKSIIK